jgi:hypothetical protein
MNVKLENGTAKVPLWAAICLLVTVLLASVGWVVAATSRASNAEHETIWNSVKTIQEDIREIKADIKILAGVKKTDAAADPRVPFIGTVFDPREGSR